MSDEEEVKKENNISKLIGNFIFFVLLFIFYFAYGSTILYGCKLAAANLLPYDVNTAPYVDNNTNPIHKSVDIFNKS
jgi:hypothetical protein